MSLRVGSRGSTGGLMAVVEMVVLGSRGAGSRAMSISGSRVWSMVSLVSLSSWGWVEVSKVDVFWVAKEDSRSAILWVNGGVKILM